MVWCRTYYFWILFISACRTARTSAVFCGENVGRKAANINGDKRCMSRPPCGSGGPSMETMSGKIASSVENVRVNWSNSDFLGSTFVGDKHESNTDLNVVDSWSDVRHSDCFFFPVDIALVEERNNLLRRSLAASFSRGGLFVTFDWWCCASEFKPSGSV